MTTNPPANPAAAAPPAMSGTRARETSAETAFPAARVPAAAASPASAAFSAAPTGGGVRLAPALARDLPLLDAFAVLRAEVDLEVEAGLERPDLEVEAELEGPDLEGELRREVELRPLLPARDCDLDPREREDPPPFDVLAG